MLQPLRPYTGTQFNIIGYWISDIDNGAFTGVFDGDGHTISNFSCLRTCLILGARCNDREIRLTEPLDGTGLGRPMGMKCGSPRGSG